jgi:hypothetical protein
MSEPADYRMSGDALVADARRRLLLNRVSWGAILAGVAAALVVQVVLNVLGIGVGAASLDAPGAGDNPSAGGFALGATIWWVASGVIGAFAGGVVAGRLCGAGSRSTASWHGFVAWCVSTLVVIYLLTSAVGGLLGGTVGALGGALGGLGRAAATTVSSVAQGAGQAAGGANGDALQAQVRRLVNPNDAQGVESDIASYIRASVNGNAQAAAAARDQAVNDLARVANVSQDEARTRIQQAQQQYQQAVSQAKQAAAQAAESAREGAAQAGLYGFGALVLGAIAGWIGGAVGAPRRERAFVRGDRVDRVA